MKNKSFDIKITKKVKDILIKLDIYDRWVQYTTNKFNKHRREKRSLIILTSLKNNIQHAIDTCDLDYLLRNSFSWVESPEGYDYWYDIVYRWRKTWDVNRNIHKNNYQIE